MVTEGLARLAPDGVSLTNEVLQTVIGVEPLHSRLGANPGNAGKMVSALPHQGRQLGVTSGGHEILLLDAFRCHAGEVRDTLARIEHRHLVIDELHGVPVP